jgi:hypothetical protein
MEVVRDAENGPGGASEQTLQKRSRQILLHVEQLYKVVLKLEDLQHPMAIAATIILKVSTRMTFCDEFFVNLMIILGKA